MLLVFSSSNIPRSTPLPSMSPSQLNRLYWYRIDLTCSAGYLMFGPIGREVLGFAFWVSAPPVLYTIISL